MACQAFQDILGTSLHTCAIRNFALEVARTADPVLLFGETGVGKELLARKIHFESDRREHPFLMIDCSLYYERELMREVYGHSGIGATAKSRKGILEFASRGTCYFSHIEELSPNLQESLLQFLRYRKFRRLGDGRETTSQVRLVVSTDKNLEGFVEGGLFDRGLYCELSKNAQTIAPLRERTEDIVAMALLLAEAICVEKRLGQVQKFSEECLEALKCFPWPHNFDDLSKELQRILESGVDKISPENLSFEISSYWLGQRGDPQIRKVIDELDGLIREFKVLSRLDAEFGDILLNVASWELTASKDDRNVMEHGH